MNSVYRDKTAIQGATDLLQQLELREQWTIYTTFYIMHAIHGPKFIMKIGKHFSRLNHFIETYLIKFEEKAYEICFF